MKKINLLIAITALIFASCDRDEAEAPSNTFETTGVMAIVESGDNAASRGVNRPSSVLDWIDTIEISADHVGAIDNLNYKVSEEYTMIDDGTGENNFILEDVALGENKFEAFAKSYQQDPAEEFLWVIDEADNPWGWVDAQRNRAPNVNFNDTDNATQIIYENPTASQNIVNFDMKPESGRLIVAVRLGDKIRTTFNTNYVYVKYTVTYADGSFTPWSGNPIEFNSLHKDDLLTFYFSDNDKSIDGACVEFEFIVCDVNPIETNRFTREICVETGKSIGCVYEVDEDAVIEDLNDFNFTFDWEELDCAPCPSNDYVTTVPRETTFEEHVADLCGRPEIDHIVTAGKNITYLVDPAKLTDGNLYFEPVLNQNGSYSNFIILINGTNEVQAIDLQLVTDLYGNKNGGWPSLDPANAWLFRLPTGQLKKLKDNDGPWYPVKNADNYMMSAYDACN